MSGPNENFEGESSSEGFAEKGGAFLDNLKEFAVTHKIESAAILLLALGLCIFTINPNVGGAIIGLVCGVFLASDIRSNFFQAMDTFKTQEQFKGILLGSLLLCILYSLPLSLIICLMSGVGVMSIVKRD